MRSALLVLVCLTMTACAVVRKDAEEPVQQTQTITDQPSRTRVEPERNRPSDVLKPNTEIIHSPVNDDFYMRLSYFAPSVETEIQLNSTGNTREGTFLSAEDDLGLDDKIDQFRMEMGMRIHRWSFLRVDYFKLSRFHEQRLPRDINFGDFTFQAGDTFRTKLDWRVFTITGTGQVNFERFEAGLGLGIHIIQAQAEGREPGTLNRESASEVGPFPTIAANVAWRFYRNFSVTARGQMFSANPEDFSGKLSDYHIDVQYRWRKHFAVGLGYSMLETNLEVLTADQPLTFNMSTAGPELFFRASF
jgi:hypothetical protein